MKQQLRDYQLKAVQDIRAAVAAHKNVLFSLPTGGGKTTIIADIVEKALAKGTRVLILVHRLELCEQVRARLQQFGIIAGIIVGGRAKTLHLPIQVGTVQSVVKRVNRDHYKKFGLIIIDEAHRGASDSYLKIIHTLNHAPVIGFTATPYRTDSRTLREVFNTIVSGPTVAEMIRAGHLVSTIVYADEIDLSGVKITHGDYDEKQLFEKMNEGKIYDGVVNKYRKHSNGTAICFCINKQHAINTAEAFQRANIPAAYIYAGLPQDERQRALTAFKRGDIKVLCNVFILTEGYDLPRIDTVILNRATRSRIAWRQMIGRGLRPYPGKNVCKVIDMGNNTALHGFVEEDDEITLKLAGQTKKEREQAKEEAQTKECPKCAAIIAARAQYCQFCQYDFTAEKIAGEVEFRAFTYEDRAGLKEVWKEIPTERLIEYADSRKKKDGSKYSKMWVMYELERRGLISIERLNDGRINMKGKTVAQWVQYAAKRERQATDILRKVG